MLIPLTTVLCLIPLFIIVSVAYGMTGMGGASAYLALMTLFKVPQEIIVPTALIMGFSVAALTSFNFSRHGHVRLELLIPGLVASIPAAFFGAKLELSQFKFQIIVIIVLLLVVTQLLFLKPHEKTKAPSKLICCFALFILGLLLGFVAGIIGIGGGVLLGPVLLLFGWVNIHEAAGISAYFTAINCLVGFISKVSDHLINWPVILIFAIPAIVAGFIASHWAAKKGKAIVIHRVFGGVILAAVIGMIINLF